MTVPGRSMFLSCALFTMLGCAALCKAEQTRGNTRYEVIGEVRVDYGDLNLNETRDAEALLSRLTQAAWYACGGDPRFHRSYQTRPRQTARVYAECRSAAVDRAVNKIGDVTLTRLHARTSAPVVAATSH